MTECAKAFRLDKDSRSLQFSAYTWDAIVCEIFATLGCGGTVFVPNEEERTGGLVDYIEREGLNWLFLTPTVLRLIPPARIEGQKLTIITIGELLGRDLIEYWHDKAVLINAYGPTETCVACTAKVIESADNLSSNAIGKPFGSRAWVTAPGDHDRLMPVGSIGELVIEGPHIAEGYYKDPETTAKLFIERPQWASGTTYRFYKTGDLVRQNRDGSLIFLGRKDTQVKVNGQRIELEEVEHHLHGLEIIKNAVALVAKEGPLAGKLTALVSASHYTNATMEDMARTPGQIPMVAPQLRGNAARDVTQFRKQLEDRLPTYMIPTCWIPLTHLPMVASGKIDRSLIQRWLIDPDAPSWVVSEEAQGQPQPATPVKVQLQEIWADVLNLPPVKIGTDRSFLSLGGDSISVIKIVSRSRSHGIRVTVQDLLQRKTITELASLYAAEAPATAQRQPLKRILGISPTDVSQMYPLLHLTSKGALDHVTKTCCSQLGIQPAEIEDVCPCSPVQEGILLAQARSARVYDQRLAWKVSDASKNTRDITHKLQSAWQVLVNRHAILRTAFVEYPLPEHPFVQVVLHQALASTSLIEVKKYEQLGSEKATFQPPSRKVLHHFTICNTANHEIYCMLEFNHALGDATSVQIIAHELYLAYNSQLEPNAPPYSSFISYLTSQDIRAVQSHWESKLADVEACEFPKMGDTGREGSSRMQESLRVDALQFSSLRRLCSESGITLATLASAIWALILALFLGRDDVCFGYLASGRDIDVPGVREILGPLVTLLVSHTNVNSNLTLLQLAQTLQEGHVQSLPVQHYSLAKVYHALGMRGERLFNTVVNVLYFPESPSSDQSLSMTPVDGATPSEFNISFDFVYSDTEAQIDLMYSSDYLSHTLASNMITTISRVVLALLENPGIEIGRLSVCDELQQASLSNASESMEPLMCVHEIIKQQTLQSPHAEAVYSHDGNLSYSDLWTMSDKVSRHLANLGVKPNTYIPFCFEKSKWSIVAILSILKAGGCCVPLDPSYPSSRLEYMVDLVDATIVLASTAQAHLVQHMVTNPVIIDDAFFTGHSEDIGVNPTTSVQPDDAAYVIFTSGTTGEPKASVLEHKSLQAYLSVLGTSLNLDAQSRVIQFASFVFDISIEEILGTLSLGGCICVPSEDERLNDLALAMESRHVNWANLTPTVIRMLTPANVPHLKTLVSGGEALGDDLIKRWAPAVDMFNTLGPSECTIAVLLTEKLRSQDSGMNLGKGRSCKIWIANPKDYHLLSPVGAIGEMLIEGRRVGRGYVKNPEQTSKAFIANPAWSNKTTTESRRMYRSGDLARFNEDGTITYLGRKDHQIKIRGQRVELAEIEYHLSANPSVRSATVAFPRDGRLKGHLVAIVVLKAASLEQSDSDGVAQIMISSEAVGSSTLLALHTSLEHAVPRYMVPSFTIPIISMPLLLSGKVNRRAVTRWLEGMEQEVCELLKNSNNLKTGDMPTNDVESWIRTIWGQLLNLPDCRIGVTNSFFSLGGDSILAMQLSSRLREGKLKISVQDIFEQKTIARIAGLAQLSNGVLTESSMRKTHAISNTQIRETFLSTFAGRYDDSNIEDVFPCSSIQESILTAQAVEPDAWTALMLFEVRLQQPGQESMDLDLLQDAWLKVVNHHGILRTMFTPIEHQNLWRHGQVVLTHIHPSIVRCEMSKSQASTLGHNVREMPKHLPAHQLTIIRTSSGETLLNLQLSHALYDAMAISILLRDLRLAYDGAILASSPSYGAYITNAQNYQDHSSEAHWKCLLEGFRPGSIAVADLKNSPQKQAMRIIQAHVADFSKLQNYCQEQSMTIANLFQCVWAICLRTICGEDDICFGNMVSGRELAGSAFHGAVGPCINILPCRVDFSQHETIDSLHKALERDLFTALSHHHSSMEDIRRSLGMENKSLFDTYLNVRRARHQNQDYASALSFHYMDSYMLEQYQVVVYIDELDDGVTISLSYQSQYISQTC